MSTTGVAESALRKLEVIASTSRNPTPCFNARSDDRWITGPSAIGSENGTPSSITSAPPSTSACMMPTVPPGSGSPAVTNGMSAARRAARSFSNVTEMRLKVLEGDAGGLAHGVHVLVAAPREVHQQDAVARHAGRELHRIGEGVARFERRDDAFEPAERMERRERFGIGNRDILRAARILEPCVLGSHA